MNSRTFLVIAGVVGALGIVIGAFGAHALPSISKNLSEAEIQERTDWLETGSRYHMYHATALLVLALAVTERPKLLLVAAFAWLIGVIVFSGCLYAMAVTGVRMLGAIVPVGGLAFIVGWVSIAVSAWPRKSAI